MEQGPTDDADLAVPRHEFRLVLVGLLLAMALASLDQNIVAPALPHIVGDLGGGSHLDWVVTAFMLASTATTPLYGKLGLSGNDMKNVSDSIRNLVPVKRFGKPSEVAHAVLFLASDEAAFTVGSELIIDGGLSL